LGLWTEQRVRERAEKDYAVFLDGDRVFKCSASSSGHAEQQAHVLFVARRAHGDGDRE